MEANQLLLNQLLRLSNYDETVDVRFFVVEWRVWLDRSTVFALAALERVRVIDDVLEDVFEVIFVIVGLHLLRLFLLLGFVE